jgi:hypothetical protein
MNFNESISRLYNKRAFCLTYHEEEKETSRRQKMPGNKQKKKTNKFPV